MKTVDYTLIEKYYDERLSVQKNLEGFAECGIDISRATLYNYCKDKGISTGGDFVSYVDPNLSVRKNIEQLKTKGIKVGKDRISKILKELKKQPTYELKEDNKDETGKGELVLSVSSNRPVKIKITGDNELSITLEDIDKTQTETTTINIYKN